MKYAIKKPHAEAPPEDGQPFEGRSYDPETMDDLREWEVLVELPVGVPTDELVFESEAGGVREKTVAEKDAATRPLSGMEGLYAELQKRKATGKPDPITTDELLVMMERVSSGQVQGPASE